MFKHKDKLVYNQASVMNRLCPFFFSLSGLEGYTVFFIVLSGGNESFDLVYFLVFPFKFSTRFVV